MAKGDKCDIPVRFQLPQQVQLLFKPMPFLFCLLVPTLCYGIIIIIITTNAKFQ